VTTARQAADAIAPVACRGFATAVAIRSFLIGRDWAYRLPILVLFDEADVADQTAGVNSAIEHLLPANTNPLS